MEKNFPQLQLPVGSEPSVTGDSFFVCALSPAMRTLQTAATDVARSDTPVLIVGESGSGNWGLAKYIHERSKRRNEAFTAVDCAGLNSESFESQPNGSAAWGSGTIFLPEIAATPAACQSKLVKAFFEDGDSSKRARVIASTRKNLEQEIQAARFSADLYYRISGVCLRIPPLRHRKEDISGLCEFFLSKYATLLQRPKPTVTSRLEKFFREYSWPGNIRELEDVLKIYLVLGDEHLAIAGLRSHALESHRNNGASEPISLKQASREASRLAERELILSVLSRTRWNRKRAAQELQISYKALLYKLKQIGLDDDLAPQEEKHL